MLVQGTSRLASVPSDIAAYAKAGQAGWELYRLRFPTPRSPPLPSAQRVDLTHAALDLPPASPATLPTATVVCIDNDQILARSGAVCTSWRDARTTFRIRELKRAPCLLYASEQYGSSDAALYCPSTDATFRVPFPGPPHDKRGFVFSCNGWVFAADEVGNPYLFNPMTGIQATLPPLVCRGKNFYNDDG
ncbi:hypothetical protein ACQ4PT_026676 [Festuca glaucescens]